MVTKEFLEEMGYMGVRQMENGEWIGVQIQIYTCGLFVGLDEYGYKRRYCYEKYKNALTAAASYEGEGDPIGLWVKVKGEGGERFGPGAKNQSGMIDMNSVLITVVALFLLGLFYISGYDFGRRNLVVDMDTYGCEKVLAVYHGTGKKGQ